jgi:hypothetical protein
MRINSSNPPTKRFLMGLSILTCSTITRRKRRLLN